MHLLFSPDAPAPFVLQWIFQPLARSQIDWKYVVKMYDAKSGISSLGLAFLISGATTLEAITPGLNERGARSPRGGRWRVVGCQLAHAHAEAYRSALGTFRAY